MKITPGALFVKFTCLTTKHMVTHTNQLWVQPSETTTSSKGFRPTDAPALISLCRALWGPLTSAYIYGSASGI